MKDRYVIEKLTSEDLERLEKSHPETGATCKLVEIGYKPLNIGYYASREAAEMSRAEWIARDELANDIEDFLDNMLNTYGNRLDEEEIREMIKSH